LDKRKIGGFTKYLEFGWILKFWFFSHSIAPGKGVLNDEGEILKIMITKCSSFHHLNLVVDPFGKTYKDRITIVNVMEIIYEYCSRGD
jgi:hypothetical protein